MQRIPRIREDLSLEEKFKILYDWCFLLSEELIMKENSENKSKEG